MYRREHLQVKINTLAAEARIIKKKEQSLKRKGLKEWTEEAVSEADKHKIRRLARFNDLRDHRINVVRRAARHNLLAYTCLKGTPLFLVEQEPKTSPNWVTVEKLLARFMSKYSAATSQSEAEAKARLAAWKKEYQVTLLNHKRGLAKPTLKSEQTVSVTA